MKISDYKKEKKQIKSKVIMVRVTEETHKRLVRANLNIAKICRDALEQALTLIKK